MREKKGAYGSLMHNWDEFAALTRAILTHVYDRAQRLQESPSLTSSVAWCHLMTFM